MEDLILAAQLFDKDSYYKDSKFATFSGIKVFSKCERLYYDLYIGKTYEEPEHDYFVYGKLVDAFVTEAPEFIDKNFVKVERKINPEDALKFENKIKELETEITGKTLEMDRKFQDKQQDLISKVKVLEEKRTEGKELTPAQEKKILELTTQINDMTLNRSEFLDKTMVKGIESRKEEIVSIQTSLNAIKQLADKQQVTPSVWENAEQTALALKSHPYYSNMEFNSITSQQIFATVINGIPRKGRLDHLKLSPSLSKFYAIYKANQMTLKELREKISTMNPNDLWAIITDIKSCYDVAKLEPYNTHYRGQLGFYQDLVSDVLMIPKENIKCQIFVADKLSSTFKKAELFLYDQKVLDELKPDVEAWVNIWANAMRTGKFVSAKEKFGMKQDCYTCSVCRFCPFSMNPGEPVIVSGPRFSDRREDPADSVSIIEQAILEY